MRILSELGRSAAPSRGSESSELKAEEPQALGRTFQAKRTHTDFRPRSGTIKGHRATPPLELSTPLPLLKGLFQFLQTTNTASQIITGTSD